MRKIAVVALLLCASIANAGVNNLRCEYQQDPLGIDVTTPRLSWQLDSTVRGEVQQSVQILVADRKSTRLNSSH